MTREGRGFLRKTKQREVILSVLRSTDTHPNADWIYEEVKQVLPNVSLGTIYRNLRILVESGEALELCYGSAASRFDGNPQNHYHFVCEKCENVYDLKVPVNDEVARRLSDVTGHLITDHRLEFYGICKDCKVYNDASTRHED